MTWGINMGSTQLKEELNNPVRNYAYLKINLNVIDPDLAKYDFWCSTDFVDENGDPISTQESFSDPVSIFYSNIEQTQNYATLEPNFWILDDSQPIYDGKEELPQTFISNYMSDENGDYNQDEQKFEISWGNHSTPIIPGISFVFDEINGNYPTQIKIAMGTFEKTYTINSVKQNIEFTNEDITNDFSSIEISFLKSNIPNRRIRLEQIFFGYNKTYTNEEIIQASSKEKTTIINSELPEKTFEFTIDNMDKHFNWDNPSGVTKFLLERQPIEYYWGYMLDNGLIEWVLGNKMVLNGEINVDSDNISITATSIIGSLTNEYTEGSYNENGRSLYDLAVDVLTYNKITDYNIWEGLKSLKTDSRLPNYPSNELLQMIATAGCCTLYEDRNGLISIQPFNLTTTTNEMNYSFMTDKPKLELQPILSGVKIIKRINNIDNNVTTLYSATNVNIADNFMGSPLTLVIEHEEATNVTCVLSNENCETQYLRTYGGITVVKICKWNNSTSQTTDITLSGNLVETSESSIEYSTDNSNGEAIEYTNELITQMLIDTGVSYCNSLLGDDDVLYTEDDYPLNVGRFIANWYSNRYIYSFTNRGDILTNTNELTKIETDFQDELVSYIVENNIDYNGAWSGETSVIKLDKLNKSGDDENVD